MSLPPNRCRIRYEIVYKRSAACVVTKSYRVRDRMITLILTENQREFIRQFVLVFILDSKNRYGVLGRANGRTGSSINGARRGRESHNILLMGSSKSSLVRERSPWEKLFSSLMFMFIKKLKDQRLFIFA